MNNLHMQLRFNIFISLQPLMLTLLLILADEPAKDESKILKPHINYSLMKKSPKEIRSEVKKMIDEIHVPPS